MSGKLTTDDSSTQQSNLFCFPTPKQPNSAAPPMAPSVEHPNLCVGFIGAGNMATAMARGFLKARLVLPNQLIASARTETTLKKFRESVDDDIIVTNDNAAVVNKAGGL